MQHRAFATFLVVDDELNGNACAIRPRGVDRMRAVTDKVAGIGIVFHIAGNHYTSNFFTLTPAPLPEGEGFMFFPDFPPLGKEGPHSDRSLLSHE